MRLPKAPPKRARIEIVPMIDAIFFLLVFFMYSSLSMVKMNGLPVALPQVPGATEPRRPGPAKDAPHLMVEIGPDGGFSVGGAPVPSTALAQTVLTRLETKPETLVVLQAAKGSGIQGLVAAMDTLNAIKLKDGRTPTLLVATEAVTDPDQTVVASEGFPAGPKP